MKIMHIIPSLSSGGAERMVSKLCNLDSDNNHIVVTLFKIDKHYELNDNVTLIELKKDNLIKGRLQIIRSLIKLMKDIKPNIVQFWMKTNIYALILKPLFPNVLFVSNFRNSYQAEKSSSKILTRIASYFTNGSVYVSKRGFEERKNAHFNVKRSVIIGNGFEKQDFHTRSSPELIFGYLGRFHPVKNQQLLMDAIDKIPSNLNIKILIAGRDMTPSNFSTLKNNSEKISWLGEISDTENFYKGIDCLILTSNNEGFPNVIGEAMSFGKPVITTDAGDSYEIVGETGYKITKKPEDLAKTIIEIYYDRENLLKKSQLAFDRINNYYVIDKVINDYKEYYRLLGGLE